MRAGHTRRDLAASPWLILLFLLAFPGPVPAAEHPSLASARTLYNAGDYDAAITAAELARVDEASADAAALVAGRSYLQRYWLHADAADFAAARDALRAVRVSALSPRDRLDLLVGFGQALYFSEAFGAAAELFGTALAAPADLETADRLLLLDWWASALDREARQWPPERRAALYERIISRMNEEVRADPGSAPANYWLAAAARGAGRVEGAWDAAVAGWLRAALKPETAAALRAELDRFVMEGLIPELARERAAAPEAAAALQAEWAALKEHWGPP